MNPYRTRHVGEGQRRMRDLTASQEGARVVEKYDRELARYRHGDGSREPVAPLPLPHPAKQVRR